MASFPELVKDILPGNSPFSSSPNNLTVFNDKLYFSAFTSSSGQELWVSDGTEAGTQLVKDINPASVGSFGVGSSSPKDFFVFNGKLFFTADDGSTGQELWVTDGTDAGTQLVKDIRPGSGSSTISPFYAPADFAVFNGRLFFSANDGSTGRELWSTDGTTAGTQLFKDIFPGIGGSTPTGMTVFNGKLIFSAITPTIGQELWISDGTATGTQLLKDIFTRGQFGSGPENFTIFDNKLFFTANDFDTTGTELWVTDGTTAGTQLLKDINPGGIGSNPGNLTVVNDKLFFTAYDGTNSQEVWVTDGTTAGTRLTKDIYSGPSAYTPGSLTAFNGKLFFTASDDTYGNEVWFSDGTAAGTQLLKDITPGSFNTVFGGPSGELAVFNGKLFIVTLMGALWESDGTTAGTQLVSDIFFSVDRPQNFTILGNELLFTATSLNSGSRAGVGNELWKIAATPPTWSIAPTSADKPEGNTGTTPFTFTVTRSGNLGATSYVGYTVTGSGTNPTNAVDFSTSPRLTDTLTFAPNQSTATLTINVFGDRVVEPDETFTVTLNNPSNPAIVFSSAIGTIRDDDGAAPSVPSLAIAPATANQPEGNTGTTPFTFTLTRTGNLSAASSVQYAVTGIGTNPADAIDFGGTLPTGTVNFAANQATATITININGDLTIEPDEDFTVNLSNPSNVTIVTGSAIGLIRNDDQAITPPVTPPGTPPVTPPGTPPVTPPVTPPITPPSTPPVTPSVPICTLFQSSPTLTPSKKLPSESPALRQLFDEEFYLRQNPDVAAACNRGVFQNSFQHFLQYGQYEGRDPSGLYDERYYLSQNSDVAAAVARGNFRSGFQHFLRHGQYEGRNPCRFYNEQTYLEQNQDVAAAVSRGGFRSGVQHFLQHGFAEGRLPNLSLFSEQYYLSQNPDVAAAVARGQFKSGFQHFEQYGQREGRQPSSLFNEQYYLGQNPDVAAAVARGQFKSGFEHYLDFGRFEGRSGIG